MEDFDVDIDLSDFFSTLSVEKKKKKKEFESIVGDVDLNSIFEDFSELKKKDKESKEKVEKQIEVFEEFLFSGEVEEKISNTEKKKTKVKKNKLVETVEVVETTKSEENIENNQLLEKTLGILSEPSNSKQQTDPLTPLDQNFVTLDQLQSHYKQFLNRIQQQLSTLGGGGETNLTYMDVPITSVVSSSYTIKPQDYYIGVNYAGAVTVTLPKADREGKIFVVKDELGEASKGTNRYITILPTGSDLIDGRDRAILAFDYGSLTFIWKGNSWRVI